MVLLFSITPTGFERAEGVGEPRSVPRVGESRASRRVENRGFSKRRVRSTRAVQIRLADLMYDDEYRKFFRCDLIHSPRLTWEMCNPIIKSKGN